MLYTAAVAAAVAFSPVSPAAHLRMSHAKVVMQGGKGFGGGEATRDPVPACAQWSRTARPRAPQSLGASVGPRRARAPSCQRHPPTVSDLC